MRLRPFLAGGALAAAAAGALSLAVKDAPRPESRVPLLPQPNFDAQKEKARKEIHAFMARHGIPGLTIAVGVDGRRVWSEGFGFADVEQLVPCTSDTRMRVGSISKSITSMIAARLVDEGRLDLDAPIQAYFKDYPELKYEDKAFPVTTRQLLSHTAGIPWHRDAAAQPGVDRQQTELLSNRPYMNVAEGLKRFEKETLRFEPGTKFFYTTNGYTLASAVLEKAAGRQFRELVDDFSHTLGLGHTSLDDNATITPCRARYYHRTARHVLENVPEVDSSYKWAGGGLLSTADDLLVFANAVLFSAQAPNDSGVISAATMREILRGVNPIETEKSGGAKRTMGAMGWFYVPSFAPKGLSAEAAAKADGGYWYHVGTAVGASAVVIIRPKDEKYTEAVPQGNCVVILTNLHNVLVRKLAVTVEQIFRET